VILATAVSDVDHRRLETDVDMTSGSLGGGLMRLFDVPVYGTHQFGDIDIAAV